MYKVFQKSFEGWHSGAVTVHCTLHCINTANSQLNKPEFEATTSIQVAFLMLLFFPMRT